MVERAKRELAWKSPHARKARRGSISLSPRCISPFSWGVIYTRARVLLALLSLRKNRKVLEVYQIIDSLVKSMRIGLFWLNWKRYHIQHITKLYYFFFCQVPVIVIATVMMQRHFFFLWWISQDGRLWNYLKQDSIVITDIPYRIKGGISYIPWCFAPNFCLLSAVERAFEGFEGDFQRPEFQDAAHPR